MPEDKVLMSFVKPNGKPGKCKIPKSRVKAHEYVGWKVVKEKKNK